MSRSLWALGLLACGPVPGGPSDDAATSEAERCAITWFVDPDDGDDANDGRAPETALRTLEALPDGLDAGDGVGLRRGTVSRLTHTLALHGHRRGWTCYGAWGDPALPKPIITASVAVPAALWSAPDAAGRRVIDGAAWALDDDEHTPDGPEQAPGNLWFFADDTPDAPMTGWGYKREGALTAEGDWAWDAPTHTLTLLAADAPPLTEVALPLQPAITFSGQRHVILEDWDLRYLGGYALRGHAASDVRVRRVDVAFVGGATKRDELVRLGNGLETNGDVARIVVEASRFHELYDTGLGPQDTAGTAHQRDLVYRDNLISRAGLAAIELWLKPSAARLDGLRITGNTLLDSGFGWGFVQHDTAASPQVGAAVLIGSNEARVTGLELADNAVIGGRHALVVDWDPDHAGARQMAEALDAHDNRWSDVGAPAVVLFDGVVREDGSTDPANSPVFADLAAWQRNTLLPGQEAGSTQQDGGPRPESRPATRFGAFPVGP